VAQYDLLYSKILPFIDSLKMIPRNITDGELKRVNIYDWTMKIKECNIEIWPR